MSTNPGGASAVDTSANWRETPPHIAGELSTATQFTSARTHLGDARLSPSGARSESPEIGTRSQEEFNSPGRTPSPMPTGSLAPSTSSPFAPTGLTAKVMVDEHGNTFFIEQSAGMRIDVVRSSPGPDSGSQSSGPTPSEESDIPDTHTAGDSNTNARMASIIEDLETNPIPVDQENTLHQMRGAIALGREHLFTTTSLAVGTQDEIQTHHEEMEDFKLEVAQRFEELHGKLQSHQSQLNICISENVKVLRDLGTSEALLGKLVATAAKVRARKPLTSQLLYQPIPGNTPIPPELRSGITTALPSRRENESLEEFGRCTENLLARKERAEAVFLPAKSPLEKNTVETPAIDKRVPAEDVGSVSMAPHRVRIQIRPSERPITNSLSHTGYLTAGDEDGSGGDMFGEFQRETEEDIAKIVDKHLGEELIVPSRIKAPKLDTPAKYAGTNDHLTFIRWIESLTAWMRTMFYGGSDPAIDKYRVSVLKNLLSDTALQWYIDFVDAPSPGIQVLEDFMGVLCALHQRFITTSTAHQALRDFKAIHFKSEGDPLRLMDDLEATSKRMREPMPNVIIRQRFMKLIPAALREDLQAVRGISESYASIGQMRTHSEQLWDIRPYGRNRAAPRTLIVPTRNPVTARGNPDTRRTNPEIKNRPVNSSSNTGIKGSILKPSRLHTDKTCFKCGIHGHIGSDPSCPKFSEPPAPRDRPRVGAQRVLESYSADDDELEQELEARDDHPHEDWGGSQYESDHEDANTHQSADLLELLERDDEEGPRLGRRGVGNSTRNGRSNDEGPAREPQTSQRTRTHALEFEAHHGGDGPWSRSTTDEWECLLQLQLAEHIRNVVLRGNMSDLNRQAREARTRALASAETPRSSTSAARQVIEATSDMLEALVHATADFSSDEGEDKASHSSDNKSVPASPSPPPSYTKNLDGHDSEDANDDLWEALPPPDPALFEDQMQGPFTADGTPPARLGAMRAIESEVEPYYSLLCLDPDNPSLLITEEEFASQGQTSIALQVQISRLKARERHLALERDQAFEELEERMAASYDARRATRCDSEEEVAIELLSPPESESEEETYVIRNHVRPTPDPRLEDECILRSVVIMYDGTAEQYLTFVDHNGRLYVRIQEPPANHYLSPSFHQEHRAAMALAITERDAEAGGPRTIEAITSWTEPIGEIRDRRGYRDTPPRLLPGEAFHERLVSLDPEEDDDSADPGFHVQMLAQHVEHLSNVNRKTIYDTAQPSRLRKDIACLSAQVKINGTPAYMLFDSGSNIDSITLEFARATNCKSIPLDEQVTLQLGCVGSRSKINYGTRPPVNFGGIRGHAPPFMNKHGIILDFGAREIRFPNNRVIKALSTLEEASLLASCHSDLVHRPKPTV
ncbi:hypothetical protein K438DRAFT_1789428 [Mycena galopus ATCC 62051]|nr:hypothetical protein K438DRAFT_1789428 [Mycena galopus ATCC 62051]